MQTKLGYHKIRNGSLHITKMYAFLLLLGIRSTGARIGVVL